MLVNKRKAYIILSLILIICVATGCLPRDGSYTVEDPAGFLSGVWHGWIAPIMLFFTFFGDASIYEPINTGFPYDFGFYIAVISGFGGLSLRRKKRKEKVVYKYPNEI